MYDMDGVRTHGVVSCLQIAPLLFLREKSCCSSVLFQKKKENRMNQERDRERDVSFPPHLNVEE